MGSISKFPRLSAEQYPRQSVSEDRISNLPDDIIGYILSFLPTKEAVATSILSNRWIDVWSFITNLDLDDGCIPYGSDDLLRITFTRMVYRVLLLRKALCLNKFCLKLNFRNDYQSLDVKSWIDYALRCNVKHIHISAALGDEYYTPLSPKLFSSTTLTVLKLYVALGMNVPFNFCLPNLKIIHLDEVRFQEDGSFTRFLCGCPVLEELQLYRNAITDVIMNIIAPLLKRLVLHQDRPPVNHVSIGYTIVINAPSLVYLKIENCCADRYSIVDSPKLIRADVTFDVNVWTHHEEIADFLKALSNVQFLNLRWFGLESMRTGLIVEGHYNLPKFPNLKSLELCVEHERNFLADFLPNSPHLERLLYWEVNEPRLRLNKFECEMILTNLKDVHIIVNSGLRGCADIVNYLLTNAKILEKLTIETDEPEGLELEQELKMVSSFHKKVENFFTEARCSSRIEWSLHFATQQ